MGENIIDCTWWWSDICKHQRITVRCSKGSKKYKEIEHIHAAKNGTHRLAG